MALDADLYDAQFLSTPSARRATLRTCEEARDCNAISIHALREEGDAMNLSMSTR